MRIVIPSVNYGDLLAITLPAWRGILDPSALLVLTSDDDHETQRVAAQNGVPCRMTDAWTRTGSGHVHARPNRRMKWWQSFRKDSAPTFNLALAIDETLGLPTTDNEVFGVVDADCYPCGWLPAEASIQLDTIYGCWRYSCQTPELLHAYCAQRIGLIDLPQMRASGRIVESQHRHVPNVGEGYCQIFRTRPGLKFGSYPAADEYDFDFALQFPRGEMLETFHVLHLGENARNWDGRVTPRWEVA